MDNNEIQEIISELGDVIAQVLDPDTPHDAFHIDKIKSSKRAATFKVRLGGKSAFLKLFNDSSSFSHERRMLEMLQGLPVPKLLFVAEKQQLILTSYINGTPLAETVTMDNLTQIAEHLGQWFGQLSNQAQLPFDQQDLRTEPENWAEYLNNYSAGFDRDILETQSPILEQSAINRRFLSHNDNALANFILTNDRRLFAVDFEACQIKPEGWDLITAARALLGRMPGRADLISGALLRGYQLTAQDCRLPENFDQVISTVALSRALSSSSAPI